MTREDFQEIHYPVFKKIFLFLEKSVKSKYLYAILYAHREANVHIHKYTSVGRQRAMDSDQNLSFF